MVGLATREVLLLEARLVEYLLSTLSHVRYDDSALRGGSKIEDRLGSPSLLVGRSDTTHLLVNLESLPVRKSESGWFGPLSV